MKGEKVRVTVPMPVEVKQAFERLAAAQGCSVGRAMGDWLADTVDAAGAMASLLEKAREEPMLAMRQMHSYALGLGDMTSELMEGLRKGTSSKKPGKRQHAQPTASGSVAAAHAAAKGDFESFAKRIQDRGAEVTPPLSNTGGKLPQKSGKTGGNDNENKN